MGFRACVTNSFHAKMVSRHATSPTRFDCCALIGRKGSRKGGKRVVGRVPGTVFLARNRVPTLVPTSVAGPETGVPTGFLRPPVTSVH